MYSMFDEVIESLNIKPEICYPDFDIGTVYIYCTSYSNSIHMYIYIHSHTSQPLWLLVL